MKNQTKKCLVDCNRSHIPPLFIGVIFKSIFANFCCGKCSLRCFDTKITSLGGFERICSGHAWNRCCINKLFLPGTLGPVWEDIQMLKFGQIVDLDLIERSAPNKYVQVPAAWGVFGVTMKA